MTQHTHRSPVGRAVAGIVLLLLAAGCGDGRSVTAFCDTLRSEKERIVTQLNTTVAAGEASGDDLVAAFSNLGASITALGELRTYFNRLAAVAPDEIRTEVDIIAGQYDQMVDGAGDHVTDPFAALGSALFGGLTIAGQISTVDRYARQHCNEGL